MKYVTSFLLAWLAYVGAGLATPALPVINTNNIIVITNAPYNAAGNGVVTNTTAIQSAINAAAAGGTTNGAAGGVVVIPAGTFLCGPLTMASAVDLQINGGGILRMLPFGQYPLTYTTNVTGGVTNITWTAPNFITANNLHDLEFSGAGAIDGQGLPWWPYANTNGDTRPIMLPLNSCNRVLIQTLTLSNSPMFHIAIGGNAVNSTVQGVTVLAPSSTANPPSHNTDACDVSGTNILVENCNISTGDDDFTCGGGTSGVLLTNNTYGNGHGVSIGSYTDSGGVSNIMVINCTFNGTQNGIRIKSDNDRGGLVQNISYENLGMTNVDFPIQVYSYYNEIGTPSGVTPQTAVGEPVAAVISTTPIYRNITFSNITATSVSGYPVGIIWARTEMPATNIVFDRLNVTGDDSFCLYNVKGAQFVDSKITVASGQPTFDLFDATVIVTNSAATNTLFTFDGLTTNSFLDGFTFDNALASLSVTNAFGTGPLALSASTLTVSNSLTLFPGTTVNFTLGTNTTKLVVGGNLTLGGTNNIIAGGGFTNGTYTLMTYTGTLGGSTPVLASTPTGYDYSWNTSTAGQVNLVVSTNVVSGPATPLGLAATPGIAVVTLNWSAVSAATSYELLRATTNNGTFPTVVSGLTATNYTDTSVTNGVTYYYAVAAVNGSGTSADSAVVSATPEAGIPVSTTGNVFNDTFSASSLDSATPAAPTGTATSYEVISSKTWSPTPSMSAGHLKFGIGATTSGSVEIQALFTNAPVKLMTNGDTVWATVTFTNTSGLLTQSGAIGFGLYDSGQVEPVPGGMNSTATTGTSVTNNATGNAQNWVGYVAQLAYTGGSSQIATRSPQTGVANNNQDLVTTGSGSSSYDFPAAVTVGTAATTPSVTLTAGNSYTEELAITLTSANTLAITNTLFAGTGTNGTVLSQFGAIASGSTYLTNAFDALAIGWRATASTSATAMDINQITVGESLAGALVSSIPTKLVLQSVGSQWQFTWPADHLGWLVQSNGTSLTSTNWTTIAGSGNATNFTFTVNPGHTAVFYRLVAP